MSQSSWKNVTRSGVTLLFVLGFVPAAAFAGDGSAHAPDVPGVRQEPLVRFRLGFSADAYYTTSYNHPSDGVNRLRAFDWRDEHGPRFGLAEVWMEMPRHPVGFRLDLDWGPTAEVVNWREPSKGEGWENVQQAFISTSLNKSGSTWIEAGKWVTPIGAENIEVRDNWLASRGLLFAHTGPYFHTGLRFTHSFNDSDWIMGQVNRGWDAVGDPDHGPGVGMSGNITVSDELSVTASWHGGEEPALDGDDSWMNMLDVVVSFDPTRNWSTSFEANGGMQSDDQWYGASAMARYAFTPRQSIAFRGEVLRDDSGLVFGSDMTACSLTLGYRADVGMGWQLTGEYRQDFASDDIFVVGDKGAFSDDEGTVVIGASWAFDHAWRRKAAAQ